MYIYIYIYIWSKLMLFTSVAAFHWLHDNELTSQGVKAASFDRNSFLRPLKLGNFFVLELHEQKFSNWTELMISLMVELLWTKKVSSLFKYDFASSQIPQSKSTILVIFLDVPCYVLFSTSHKYLLSERTTKGYHNPDRFSFRGRCPTRDHVCWI